LRIRLFADDCIIYRKITNKNNKEKFQKDLDMLGEWAAENGMKINLSKSKAIRFTRAGVKNPLGYSLGDQKILEASGCKYLRIILRGNLNWVDQVNYTVKKSLEGTSLYNAFSQKRKLENKKFSPHVIGKSCS